jgi:CDP-4-dehydro-6-deoxyglucose reductase
MASPSTARYVPSFPSTALGRITNPTSSHGCMTYTITTEPAGHQFGVEPHETILAAAMRQQIVLPYGCRNGTCGSCTAELTSGRVAYPGGKTEALAGQAAGACLTCQAVPQADCTLRVAELEDGTVVTPRILPCRIEAREWLNHDVLRLHLKLPEGQRLQYRAGQYLEIILRDGRRRAFSIANPPHDDALIELHVRRVPGGELTDRLIDQFQDRAILRIQAPLGTFVLRERSTRPLIFVGGGTGFAPIKAMVEHALHVGVDRPMTLYWGARACRDLYLPDLPEQWAGAIPGFRYVPVLSEPDAEWNGRAGFVHTAVVDDHPDIADYDVYLSGPPVMVEAGRGAFEALGLSMDHMFSDAFEWAADSRARGR